MKDIIVSYSDTGVRDELFLENGCLHMVSEVYGDIYSKMHYSLDEENCGKLLRTIGGKEKLAEIFSGTPMSWKIENLCSRYGIKYEQDGF